MTAGSSGTLRQATLEDGPAASELVRSLALANPESRDAIDAHWKRLWVDNPAMTGDGPKPPLGWVLEKKGRMVGFFCNVPRLYYFGTRRVIVSVASQWGLDKSHRRKIHQLAGAYFEQDNADILMATTANTSAGRIFRHYGAWPIPQPDYDWALYWIVDGAGFIAAGLKRKGLPSPLGAILSALAGPLFGAVQSRPKGNAEAVDDMAIGEIDGAFDELWRAKQDEADRLLACRSADSLRWHFGDGDNGKGARVLAHRRDGRLRGYGVVMREDAADIGLKRLRIVDLFVENDDPAVVDDVLAAAHRMARAQGCHVLEWVGMPTNLRTLALAHHPRTRALPTWPLYFKAADGELATALQVADAWYVTAYDGDTTLA